ncbi:MAG: sensor domain-containing diguanylate cyclase [Candidatus Omnitrophica bacterium]|nr:sensor domain-containing diguanylate cyclase [Candidatus Omnitrophota bacterium]
MTRAANSQLFSRDTLTAWSLLGFLAVFFLYAAVFELRFFGVLAFGALAIFAFIFPFHFYIQKKQSSSSLHLEQKQEEVNLAQAEINKLELASQSYRTKIINYSQLKGLTEKLSMCLYVEDTSRVLSSEANRLFGGQDTTIILYLFHSRTGDLGISASHKGQMKVNLKSKKGDIYDQWVIKAMQPLLVEDTKADYRFDVDKFEKEDSRPIRSLVSVPLMGGQKALGILRIDSPKENYFDTEDLRFLKTIGDLGAIGIENAQLYERVEQLAIRDGLTGLYLRKYLYDRIPEEFSRHLRTKASVSLLMADLDNFKQYNDKFGHMAGDIVLRTFAMFMTELFKDLPGSVVCRYGGEEFCVLVPYCDKAQAGDLAEKLRKKIEGQPILLRREKTQITISIGIATFPDDAVLKEELILKADQALYSAKAKGRNRVGFA